MNCTRVRLSVCVCVTSLYSCRECFLLTWVCSETARVSSPAFVGAALWSRPLTEALALHYWCRLWLVSAGHRLRLKNIRRWCELRLNSRGIRRETVETGACLTNVTVARNQAPRDDLILVTWQVLPVIFNEPVSLGGTGMIKFGSWAQKVEDSVPLKGAELRSGCKRGCEECVKVFFLLMKAVKRDIN